jgi:hypothetical protein
VAAARVIVGSDAPLIYYLRRDGLIKIGYTAKFADRMRKLRPDELLAVEPGNIPLETGRHLQFAEHRVLDGADGREWYQPARELLEHIDRLAAMYEAPLLPTFRPEPPAPVMHEPIPKSELGALFLRALRGEANLDELDIDTLVMLGRGALHSRELVHHATVHLNPRGVTFAEIGSRCGVTESTASRWVNPPKPMGRPRRPRDGEAES